MMKLNKLGVKLAAFTFLSLTSLQSAQAVTFPKVSEFIDYLDPISFGFRQDGKQEMTWFDSQLAKIQLKKLYTVAEWKFGTDSNNFVIAPQKYLENHFSNSENLQGEQNQAANCSRDSTDFYPVSSLKSSQKPVLDYSKNQENSSFYTLLTLGKFCPSPFIKVVEDIASLEFTQNSANLLATESTVVPILEIDYTKISHNRILNRRR